MSWSPFVRWISVEPVLLDAAAVRKLARDAGLDVSVAREDDAIVVSTRAGAPLLDVDITGPGSDGLFAEEIEEFAGRLEGAGPALNALFCRRIVKEAVVVVGVGAYHDEEPELADAIMAQVLGALGAATEGVFFSEGDGFSNRHGALVVADPDADPDEDASRMVAVLDDETWAAATLPAPAAPKALAAGALPDGAEVERAMSAFARTLKRGPR